MVKILQKVRLSWFFFGFLVLYVVLAFIIPGATFTTGALTLFSVNSFLYGFYISPVLTGQKLRIDDLNKTIRAEANAIFDMMLKAKKLGPERVELQTMFEAYIKACLAQRKPAEGEDEYEALISYCVNYQGKDQEKIDKILTGLVANQQNRSNLAMQLGNKVFNNEWWIIMVLFSITLGFVMTLDVGGGLMLVIKALLCTGLSMLMVNLLKLSTLTHKKAKNIWDPLQKLVSTRFYRID